MNRIRKDDKLMNKKAILGINTIWDTDRWMCDLGLSEEDAKTYSHCSGKKGKCTCPNCGKIKYKAIHSIYNNKTISCSCGDKIPYTEKIMNSTLTQLQLNFKTQLNKYDLSWCQNYRYDFYFKYNNEQYICEVNGLQHYKDVERFKRTLEEEQENDRIKKELALSNGIKKDNYIVIDCRESKLEFIQQNIINSRLNDVFDLSKINWLKAEEFACCNLVKIACDYRKSNPDMTPNELSEIMGYGRKTITKWFKQGHSFSWCHYDAKEEQRKSISKYRRDSSRAVEVFKDGVSLGIFPSCTELASQSLKLFGIEFSANKISKVCLGNANHHRHFTFKYV
jgi:hypothetical protein